MSENRMYRSGFSYLGFACLVLASCDSANAPAPAPTPTDGPRSIFKGEGATEGSRGQAQPVLPPLETTLGFPDGTAELTEAVRAELATLLDSPQMAGGGRIVLGGHSDSGGSDETNLAASQQRAEAVRDYLIENGVAEERIRVIAFGEQNPAQPNALPDGSPNEAGRAANRRVEITIETGAIEGEDARKPTLIETITRDRDEVAAESAPTRE